MRQLLEMAPAQRQMPALPDMPVAVIVAGKYLHLPIYEQMPLDSRRFFEADLSHRVEVLQQLVRGSSNGTLLLATEASHAVHKDAPGLVVWAVRRVLEAQPPTR